MKVNANTNRNGVKVNTDRKVNKKKVEQHQKRTNRFKLENIQMERGTYFHEVIG